jgi:SAM-dependent methyltransferase
MPTIAPEPGSFSTAESHHAREMAESFGTDPGRYDRARPSYPDALVERIVAGSPGPAVLDVGIGTGVAARSFRAAGCRVLGVEVDPRMAAFAREGGFEVEVAAFEAWDPVGRTFDAVIAGQAWHWVDPAAGAGKAAEVLRAGGRLAAFWNVFQPPAAVGEAFAATYRRVLPDSPFFRGTFGGTAAYSGQLTRAADGIRAVGAFGEPEQWTVDWKRPYTRDEWLDLVPTSGGHSQFPPGKLDELLASLGQAIDAVGGSFVMEYTAVAVTAVRADVA